MTVLLLWHVPGPCHSVFQCSGLKEYTWHNIAVGTTEGLGLCFSVQLYTFCHILHSQDSLRKRYDIYWAFQNHAKDVSYQHHMQNSLIEYYILYPEEHIKCSFKVNWRVQHTQFTRVESYFQRYIFNIISYSVHPRQISRNQLKQDLCYRYRNSALHRRQDGRNPHTL